MASNNNNTISQFSATMIGHTSSSDRHAAIRDHFKQEAKELLQHTSSIHYSRRLKNMQVLYPDTIGKLNNYMNEKLETQHLPSSKNTSVANISSLGSHNTSASTLSKSIYYYLYH